ncbi:MAG: DUF2723 domain-containing protein, partial [Elusimicrobia bacterium]|nr:DUF2723 domain-containing protein [Elusimicrobiota bacterium]
KGLLLITAGFAAVFAVYVLTACRVVPPYRDSGELIAAADTLSVAHSPGYPLYMVTGKAWISILGIAGLGPAHSMNLLSAAAGALAVLFMMFLIYDITGSAFAALLGGLSGGFSYMNWYLAAVSEMYTLNLFFVFLLLYLVKKEKYFLSFFVSGLAFGNRPDFVFVALSAALYVMFTGRYRKINIPGSALCFFAGFSVYMYLPLRAAAEPYLNWGDPSNMANLWKVMSRSSYGHTLDLISREVTASQVVWPQIKRFFVMLAKDLAFGGMVLAVTGFILGLKEKKYRNETLTLGLIFFLTGPFFLFLAKMPLNPHALAIVEVAYMIPEAVAAVFVGLGVSALTAFAGKKGLRYLASAAAAAAVLGIGAANFGRVDLGRNYIAEDYALNILDSLGENAVLFMRRDHTMFSLWYKKDIDGVRRDVNVVSKGLVSAPWYREKLAAEYPGIGWDREYTGDDGYITGILEEYPQKYPFYITAAAAAELGKGFFRKYELMPHGLVYYVARRGSSYSPAAGLEVLKRYRLRNEPVSSLYHDFFSRDFMNLYSKAYEALGSEFLKAGAAEKAKEMYSEAMRIDPSYSKPHSDLAYCYFSESDFSNAERHYLEAVKLLREDMDRHTRKSYFREELARYYSNLGAVYEKRGRAERDEKLIDRALENYENAVKMDPSNSQAYYNKSVVYWYRKDWENAVKNLREALKYDPENSQIKNYLAVAEKNLLNK